MYNDKDVKFLIFFIMYLEDYIMSITNIKSRNELLLNFLIDIYLKDI